MALTTSAQTLIVGVFRALGITAAGEQPTADELRDGFARFNEMIDGWAIERLTQRLVARRQYATVAGQASYTIAPAGTLPAPDWIGPRPDFVDSVALLLTNSTPNTEIPLGELTEASYQAIMQKDLPNSQPTTWHYSATVPAGTFTLWPVPNQSLYPIIVYTPEALPQFADLTTEYVLAPGYVRALRYALAREIAHEFGRELPMMIGLLAAESLAALQAKNVPMLDLAVDAGLVPTSGRAGYNISTGTGGG